MVKKYKRKGISRKQAADYLLRAWKKAKKSVMQ